jgi:hypothetical protein
LAHGPGHHYTRTLAILLGLTPESARAPLLTWGVTKIFLALQWATWRWRGRMGRSPIKK